MVMPTAGRNPIRSLALLTLIACSARAPEQQDDLAREEAARLAEKEGIPAYTEAPPKRCEGVWDCTKTIFTDFVYLPVNVVRGMSGDVRQTAVADRAE